MDQYLEHFSVLRSTFGPNQDDIAEHDNDLNELLFNRKEKVGKFIDFNLGAQTWIPGANAPLVTTQTNPGQDEFMTVESKAEQKLKSFLKNQNKIRVQQTKQQQIGMTSYIPPKGKQNFRNYQRVIQVRTKFKESGFVKADWEMLLEVQKQQIDKVTVEELPEKEELFQLGGMRAFDQRLLNKMNKHQDLKMNLEFRIHSSTSDDGFMNQLLMREMEDEDKSIKKVFITEEILLQLMTVKYQVVPWDVKVLKEDNILVFDKFEKKDENNNYVPSYIDLMISNENTSNNMPEEEKDFVDLCKETSFIHNAFINKAFSGEIHQGEVPEEYQELVEEELEAIRENDDHESLIAQLNYKYVKYSLGDKVQFFVRLNQEGYVMDRNGAPKEVMAKCFNEYDLTQDMRGKLVTNKGALITSESKNNLSKICKWLCQAQLSDIDEIKLGFVSRTNQNDSKKQQLLAVDTYSVGELTNILSFKPKECWGVIEYFINQLSQHQNDYYALVKVPFKPNVKLYHIPDEQ